MVEYNTLKSTDIKYGTNNFLEVARKEIEGAEFISLSKGYFLPDGTKRYKAGIGFPDDGATPKRLADAVMEMAKAGKKKSAQAEALAKEAEEITRE
jgi:hypothetical protein